MDVLTDEVIQRVSALGPEGNFVHDDGQSLGVRVAEALGWLEDPARLELLDPIATQTGQLKLARGFLGPQRAALFAANGADAVGQSLPEAARFAYHSSIYWGLVADAEGAVVFNSHWIRNNNWFYLPKIRWDEVGDYRDVLSALTPKGLAAGRLEQVAPRIYRPEDVLTPVDDALVARLDHWRREALRYGRTDGNLDEDLHTLFAQLFVLRAVEDRGLAPNIPSLEATIRKQGPGDGLRSLFGLARDTIQSQLFSTDPLERFPDFVLAGIVQDLYTPSQLPPGSQRYNFAWIDADVLGRAYEKYLANVYRPAPPIPQMSLFEQPLREVEPVSVRKSGGVYYTPGYLVGALTETAIQGVFAENEDPEFIPRVADFACGSGSFLVEAVSVLIRRLRERDPNRNWARTLIEGRYVLGIDLDYRAVLFSRLNLWIRFTEEPDALPLPTIDHIVVIGDSLREEVWANLPEKFDVVLGNPPFIATGSTQSREELTRRFRTARGRFDYAYLFVELAVDHLAPMGILGMVVPNRLFRNRDAGPIRELLTAETDVVGVLDFGTSEVFEGHSVYIGAIVARKRKSSEEPRPRRVRAVVVPDVSDTRYLGGSLTNALTASGKPGDYALSAFDIPRPSGNGPWALLSPGALRSRLRLEESGVPLGQVCGVFQGIRTGANDIFIVQSRATDGPLIPVVNALGESAILEAALLHPMVFGSDIQRYEALRSDRMLLYPYRVGGVIPESQIQEMYPSAYEYLSRYRDLLADRGSIAESSLRWYELVRKRDEEWLSSPKLLTRDLATRTAFTPDEEGQYFLVGGTAVVPPDWQLGMPLLAYLNSAVVSEYLRELTPAFRGAFQKFEPQHLSQLPVPAFLVELDATAERLGMLAVEALRARTAGEDDRGREVEAEIDDIVAEATGFRA